ncbi:MAG: D-alanine--D-alanine ligase family protein [Nitriliruptoraceae bacterium]
MTSIGCGRLRTWQLSRIGVDMQHAVVVYGGRSSEHAISCLSAKSVLEVVDRNRYTVTAVGVTREGRWTLTDGVIEVSEDVPLPEVPDSGPTAAIVGTRRGPLLVELDDEGERVASRGIVDVVFPLMHGPWGEDGTVQGMLATVGVPYVGADVTASSIGIDKIAMKASFAAAGIPQTAYEGVRREAWLRDPSAVADHLADRLTMPWFVKPARQGSSIGITKLDDAGGLAEAMELAFEYDEVAIIEQGVEQARELEVGVLGEATIDITPPGEVIASREFYDFDAKYLADSQLTIPAPVTDRVRQRIITLAHTAYRAIGCRGMARIDFFVFPDDTVLVNEINTIPGFTPMSMFPRLWQAEGLDYSALVDRLLRSARV